MAFKADTSFLRFLTMGAIGARQTMAQMRSAGFEPIELERYGTSNKIWSTKVKRLRLPDLLCVRTGVRVEVRAKSDLKIRMSDAPSNPMRRWNTGLRGIDLSAFITCFDHNGTVVPADEAVFFTVGSLHATEDASELGPPKSASEGAERDRTWPSIVPSRNGVVDYVDADVLRVTTDADGERPQRSQTYRLRGKVPYVAVGDRFFAGASILAGLPRGRVHLGDYRDNKYDPLSEINAANPVDRYAAVKSLPYRHDSKQKVLAAIEKRLDIEDDHRVLLEAAGAGTALESSKSWERLRTFVWDRDHDRADLRMEAILILTELRSPGAQNVLCQVATDERFLGNEIRQAAVWGLGKAGLRRYGDLIQFIGDADRDVVLHAIAGFGNDTPALVIDALIKELISADVRRAPAASEALKVIGNDLAISRLIDVARENGADSWALATLGRMPCEKVRAMLRGDPLLDRLMPLLLLSSSSNWIADDLVDIDLKFLLKQNL